MYKENLKLEEKYLPIMWENKKCFILMNKELLKMKKKENIQQSIVETETKQL